MNPALRTRFSCFFFAAIFLFSCAPAGSAEQQPAPSTSQTKVLQLLTALRAKAKTLESAGGMRLGFQSFTAAHKLPPESIRYSDYVIVRLLFEATRDAGLWNLHWTITDQPPNSDRIWSQWRAMGDPSVLAPTAIAECDELSALYAFLAQRVGVKSVGLFWPYPNHTVAVWTVRPAAGPAIRVVVPTSQIFLTEADTFDTKTFNPWRQKTIYEYTRRDVPDSFDVPKPLFDFFLQQLDKYAGASDATLQQLRYLREAVFVKSLTLEQAAREALRKRAAYSVCPEDFAAFQHFADDLRPPPH
jgi:hypothetical protein